MNTGIKALDKLLNKFGVRALEGGDELQSVTYLRGGDKRAVSMKLPFCFYRIIMSQPVSHTLRLHQFYLPYRKVRLASFLIDEKGQVIEQVYYQRDCRHVNACRQVQNLVAQAHRAQLLAVA